RVAWRPVPRVLDNAEVAFLPCYFRPAGGRIGVWRSAGGEGRARQEKHEPRRAGCLFHSISSTQAPEPARVSSTRRFCARPCGVSFAATGSASPRPRAETRFGLTPCETRKLSTVCARFSDSCWLLSTPWARSSGPTGTLSV